MHGKCELCTLKVISSKEKTQRIPPLLSTCILWGDNVLSTEVNNCIFSYVQTYIHETNRFN
jgi:hypothetical protein